VLDSLPSFYKTPKGQGAAPEVGEWRRTLGMFFGGYVSFILFAVAILAWKTWIPLNNCKTEKSGLADAMRQIVQLTLLILAFCIVVPGWFLFKEYRKWDAAAHGNEMSRNQFGDTFGQFLKDREKYETTPLTDAIHGVGVLSGYTSSELNEKVADPGTQASIFTGAGGIWD